MTTKVVRYGGNWTNYVHIGASICASLSNDAQLIVSSATHGQLLVREVASGDVVTRMNGHWNSVGWINWSPDNRHVVSTCSDATARVWDSVTGESLWRLDHPATVTSAEFLPDGQAVATSCLDGYLRVWDLTTNPGDQEKTEIRVSTSGLESIMPSHDGRRVMALSETHAYLILDGALVTGFEVAMDFHARPRARWSPDDARVALPTKSGIAVLTLDTDGFREAAPRYRPLKCGVMSVDWNPDGSLLVAGLEDGRVETIAPDASKAIHSIPAHSQFVWDVHWHPTHERILSVGVDGSAAVWATPDLAEVGRLGYFSRGISAVDWSPSEERIVSSSADGVFCIWDVPHRTVVREVPAHRSWIRTINWNIERDQFLTASQDGRAAIWTPDGEQVWSDDLQIGELWAADWTGDGRVAAASFRGRLCVVDPSRPGHREVFDVEPDAWLRGLDWGDEQVLIASASGRLHSRSVTDPSADMWPSTQYTSSCFDVAISPDGDLAAVALADGNISLVALGDGSEIDRLEGHEDQVWSVSFGNSGEQLVSAGADGSVRVWDLPTRREDGAFSLTTSCISARMSPSGKLLFGSSGAWTLDPRTASPHAGSEAKALTDSPIAILDGPADEDLLGRSPLVEELAFFLHRTSEQALERCEPDAAPDGFIVHLGGRWGSGKTSLAHDLTRRVEVAASETDDESQDRVRHWLPVHFSAWSAAGLGPAWWSIAMAVRRQLLAELSFIKRIRLRFRETRFRFPWLMTKVLSVVAVLALAVVAGLLLARPYVESLTDAPSSSSGSRLNDTTALLADTLAVLVPVGAAVFAASRLIKDARRRWRWPHRRVDGVELDTDWDFGGLPRSYFGWLQYQAPRDLLLIVDDLDRCGAEFVAEVLAALQLMVKSEVIHAEDRLAAKGTHTTTAVLVLADKRWMVESVEGQLPSKGAPAVEPGKRAGAAFLEKVLIASVEIPKLDPLQRRSLLSTSVDQTGQPPAAEPESTAPLYAQTTSIAEGGPAQSVTSPSAPRGGTQIVDRLPNFDPSENTERMHVEIVQRMNRPEFRAAEEGRLLDDFAPLMDPTPRGVKRTLVSFWLNRALAFSLPVENLDDELIMRWSILTMRWPTAIAALSATPRSAWDEYIQRELGMEAPAFTEVTESLDLAEAVSIFGS